MYWKTGTSVTNWHWTHVVSVFMAGRRKDGSQTFPVCVCLHFSFGHNPTIHMAWSQHSISWMIWVVFLIEPSELCSTPRNSTLWRCRFMAAVKLNWVLIFTHPPIQLHSIRLSVHLEPNSSNRVFFDVNKVQIYVRWVHLNTGKLLFLETQSDLYILHKSSDMICCVLYTEYWT